MKKIDRRRNYKIVLDTETCPLDKDFEGVSPENMWAYDIGWAVCDKHGNIYETRSYMNADIFLQEKELMKSAYYAEKIPKYWEEIKSGKRLLTSFYNIRKQLMEDIETYNITEVYAYNMRFDYNTLNNTQRWLTKSKYRYYFPKDVEIKDIMKMAQDVIAKTPTYKKFCFDNGFLTNHKTPRPQLKAETVYRYMTQDTEFKEEHTGLEDVMIEVAIMSYCYKKHKKMRQALFN
jgi:hypothetical protein